MARIDLMRRLILSLTGILIFAFCLLALYQWDASANRGRKFGYWGEYNRTSDALSVIPGAKIVKRWHNLDVSLEEFGFEIETNGHSIHLFFAETDAIRTMSGTDAIIRLQTLIQTELANTSWPENP